MRKLELVSAAILCAVATPALSLSDQPYITEADIDIASLLPSPPAETSMMGKLDLAIVAELQKDMTPERVRAR